MTTYKIIRFRRKGGNVTIRRGLSLSDAQAWCSRDDTKRVIKRTGETIWFDGYTAE
jgi:hypothetical protein